MKKCVINSFGSGDMTLTREPFTSLTRCKSAKISISLLTFRTYRVYKKIRVSWTEERTNNPKTCLSLNYTANVIFFTGHIMSAEVSLLHDGSNIASAIVIKTVRRNLLKRNILAFNAKVCNSRLRQVHVQRFICRNWRDASMSTVTVSRDL